MNTWIRAAALTLSALLAPDGAAATPDWVESGGRSVSHPETRYLTGFAMARGPDRLTRARSAAAADLASRVEVRIEHELRDVSLSGKGADRVRVASITRSTSDIRLHGVAWRTHEEGDRVWALAVLDRTAAAATRRRARERSLVEVRACLELAQLHGREGRESSAVETYEGCRGPIAAALEHDAVAAALLPAEDGEAHRELVAATRSVDEQVARILTRPFSDLREAARSLSSRLSAQGVEPGSIGPVAPFTYGATDISSEFGRSAAIALEAALASRAVSRPGLRRRAMRSVRGVYLDAERGVHLTATVRDVRSGRLVGSAEVTLARSAAGPETALRPANFWRALADQALLAPKSVRDAELRVDLWTRRGRRDLVYEAGDELVILMRVSQPAWVRLVYVLQDGAEVLVDPAFAIGADDANAIVEYPSRFEVVAPFGVEHVHATAFSREPEPLATRTRRIDGVEYEVVVDGLAAVVRARGLQRLGRARVGESLLTITTMPPREPHPRGRARAR